MAENEPKFPPVEGMSYAECVAQLENILKMMQSDNCDIDHLAAYTRRAAELLRACRSRLVTTEEELQSILATLEQK